MYEADKPLAKEKKRTFSTESEEINYLQQKVDAQILLIQSIRKELEKCHEKITKLSQK